MGSRKIKFYVFLPLFWISRERYSEISYNLYLVLFCVVPTSRLMHLCTETPSQSNFVFYDFLQAYKAITCCVCAHNSALLVLP